jgi:hypothetical protein
MKAKYYIYWNLHKNCYSVRFKGKVIAHLTSLTATGVTFKVSQKGRQKVLREQKKNVHAFVVADKIFPKAEPFDLTGCDLPTEQVKYNPYKYNSFVDSEEKALYNCGMLWMISSAKTPCLLRIK